MARTHRLTILRQRKVDGSLVWKCTRCKHSGLGLIGPCKAVGQRGRSRKVKAS